MGKFVLSKVKVLKSFEPRCGGLVGNLGLKVRIFRFLGGFGQPVMFAEDCHRN